MPDAKKYGVTLLISLFFFSSSYAQTLPADTNWFTLGANYQRSSWVNSTLQNQTEIRGNLNVEWYQPIEPYIPYKVQPVFSNNTAFISTSKGLYAFDLGGAYSTGQSRVKWVYPTELPLGHSPTVVTVNNILTAYVGGYDRKIHAIDANTGLPVTGYTPYEAEAGFETNPLIINNTIYAGNRDGYFYSLDAQTGSLNWSFKTDGPILFSAAYKNNTLYFASNDSYAYALDANAGTLIWKSQKLPGAGFHSYWPVVYTEKATGKDYVVFGGSNFYRSGNQNNRGMEGNHLHVQGMIYLFPDCNGQFTAPTCPWGRPVGPISMASQNYWAPGTQIMDVNNIVDYTEDYPQNRTAFVLDAGSGQEYTFDSDGDGKTEYAPFTHANVTSSGNRYPALVGSDGILYMDTHYASAPWISRGMTVGWRFGTHEVSRVYRDNLGLAQDEPVSFAGGGKLIYYSLTGDRESGAFDITIPSSQPSSSRSWMYYDQGGGRIMTKFPDYHPMYNDGDAADYNDFDWAVYSGKNYSRNGVYSKHGTTQSPAIPYQGKLYMLRGNSLMAWKSSSTTPVTIRLPLADIAGAQKTPVIISSAQLQQRLEEEIQKMLAAGHLRPGYKPGTHGDQYGIRGGYNQYVGAGEIMDYFQNPSETVVTMIQALPYLLPALQDQVKIYLQTYYGPGSTYDITRIVHVGWNAGAPRESLTMPSDLYNFSFSSFGSRTAPLCTTCGYWTTFPPYSFYAAWKYAQTFGQAQAILTAISSGNKLNDLNNPAQDSYLIRFPNVLNQYIAGFYGYLKLQELAGVAENASYRATYNRLLNLRIGLSATDTVKDFSKDTPFWPNQGYGMSTSGNYFRHYSIARNFMFLTPELGDYLNQDQEILPLIEAAVNEYEYVAPYWFVSKFDQTVGEGTLQHLYDYPALFQAMAWILKQPYSELAKWIDVPAFERGDLFYVQNLVTALGAAQATPGPTGDVNNDAQVDVLDIQACVNHILGIQDLGNRADVNGDGSVDVLDVQRIVNIILGVGG